MIFICRTMLGFCEATPSGRTIPPALLLVLSRLCRDFEQSTIAYILTLTDEQFLITKNDRITPVGFAWNDFC